PDVVRRMPPVPPRRFAVEGVHEADAIRGLKRSSRDDAGREDVTHMDIKRSGSQPPNRGPAEYFTGAVRIDPLFQAHEPARAIGVSVTFEPGARTAWHSHPLGQSLIVTAGGGR